MSYLDRICKYKREELEARQRKISLSELSKRADDCESARPFFSAVTQPKNDAPAIIAEIKQASPSRGLIVQDFDPIRIAHSYEENGAAALSILTDEHFFQGRLETVREVKSYVKLPVLRKDFTLHEYHIYEARAAQADAVLLIARILEEAQLSDYRGLCLELGMCPLIEVHDQADLKKLGDFDHFGDALLGINNRNLETFETDLETTEQLKKPIPEEISVVSESGLHERADVERLMGAGVTIFLIGEALLVAEDTGQTLRRLRGV